MLLRLELPSAGQDCVVLLGSETGNLVAAAGRFWLEKGLKAGAIIKTAVKLLGGAGCGEAGEGTVGGKGGDAGGDLSRPLPPIYFDFIITIKPDDGSIFPG
jgi:hypothetical protein